METEGRTLLEADDSRFSEPAANESDGRGGRGNVGEAMHRAKARASTLNVDRLLTLHSFLLPEACPDRSRPGRS